MTFPNTTFVNQVTTIAASWLQAVNDFIVGLGTTSGTSSIGYTEGGTGAASRDLQTKTRETISVMDFTGVDNTGIASSTAGILAACNEAAAKGATLHWPAGTYKMSTTLALTSAHNGLSWRLDNATISKGASVDLITVTNCTNFSVDGVGILQGNGATYTGRGLVITGTGSQYLYVGPGIETFGFNSNHFYFGADAGYYAHIECDMFAYTAQADPAYHVLVNGPDSSAIQRSFYGTVQGTIKLTGALATHIRCPLVNRVETDAATSVLLIAGVSWSNNGLPMTLNSPAMQVTGCRFSGNVTLSSTFGGSFVGNAHTGGTFTDNSIGGNALVLHHPISTGYSLLCKCSVTMAAPSVNQEISVTSGAGYDIGDAGITWSPDATSTNTLWWNTPFTAGRTATLTTTGARDGMRITLVRTASATGASTLTIGTTGKTLAVGQWAVVEYGNSAWRVIQFGSL